jgi:leucine dehydrogenase
MTTYDDAPLSAALDDDFEDIVYCSDAGVGLQSVIAIHDTTLGPSLGGIRMRAYPNRAAAVTDAKRLAEAMTYKAALAGLDLGGGKSVINAAPDVANRDEILLAHARHIESLGGRYIPAVDMGTSVADLALVGTVVSKVSSRRRNPSEFTAQGVVASIRAAVHVTEGADLAGKRVGIQGLGHVGGRIAVLLAAEGAKLAVADIDSDRARRVGAELGAEVVSPSSVLTADLDVLCPCAAGGVITADLAQRIRAKYVIGAANNMLATSSVNLALQSRGIVYVPDFVANAGGLIACAAEIDDDDSALHARVETIGDTTGKLLRKSANRKLDTGAVALLLAEERIAARRASAHSGRLTPPIAKG